MSLHYLPAFTENQGVRYKAACGEWILPPQHSTQPNCEPCLDYLTSEAAALALDPVEAVITAETKADHSKAKQRGERVAALAWCIASELDANGMLRGSAADARVQIQRIVAEDLYGNQAVDLQGVR